MRLSRVAEAAALLSIVAVAAAVSGWIIAGHPPVVLFSDSYLYLQYAEFYRGMFSGQMAPGIAEAYGASRYPPLFPLLLALVDGGHSQQALVITNVLALLAAVAMWFWLRGELERRAATLAVLAVILTPAWLLWLLTPVSEPLLALLTTGACALAAERRRTHVLVVAALVGIAPLARMAALPFVAAGLLWLWRRTELPRRDRVLATAAMVVPALAWLAYRSILPQAESYAGAVVGPGALLKVGGLGPWLATETGRVFAGLGDLWYSGPGLLAPAATTVVLALAAVGTVARLRRNTLDAAYLPGYLALVVVWPYPAETERLLVVVIPFLVVAAIEGARSLARSWAPRAPEGAVALAVPLLLLAVATPELSRFVRRAAAPADPQLAPYQREYSYLREPSDAWAQKIPELYLRVQLTMEALPGLVPPTACVYSGFPWLVRYWTGVRAVAYPRSLADAAQAQRELTRCDYFVVAAMATPQLDEPSLYPLAQVAGWTRPLIANSYEYAGESYLAAAVLQRLP